MNREEIIRLAQEAGLIPPPLDWPQKYAEALERFAALVAVAEREACAKVCEDDGMLWGARYAAKIRARGEK